MKSYCLYHRYWPYPVMGATIHSSFHCVQNQIETFRHRCTPTDKHEQSLKLNLYSCVLGFLRAVWCDSSVKQSTLARLFCVRYQTNLANVRLIFPLYRWLSYGYLCGSHKRTLLIQADIFFVVPRLFFVCKILYIGIAFQIKRRYLTQPKKNLSQ